MCTDLAIGNICRFRYEMVFDLPAETMTSSMSRANADCSQFVGSVESCFGEDVGLADDELDVELVVELIVLSSS